MKTVKAIEVYSDDRKADQWALFRGMGIAKKHLPRAPFQRYSALAMDIAVALQGAFDSCGGTKIPSPDAPTVGRGDGRPKGENK